jgi:alanine dehydrogenase
MVSSLSILKEHKTDQLGREIENRVIFLPSQIREISESCPGLKILVEEGAGQKIDIGDEAYQAAGAAICSHGQALCQDLVVGVKETRLDDFPGLRDNIFVSFQHFAKSRERTIAARSTKATYLALETMERIKDGQSHFPCLTPMSEAAAKIVARHADEFAILKKKIITSGMDETGLHGAKTAIIGGGAAGRTAAEEFAARGCEVFLLEKNRERIKELIKHFSSNRSRFPKVAVMESSPRNLQEAIRGALFLVSAVYVAGICPEKLVTKDMLRGMEPGGCVYPIDIDQGGAVEGVTETSILDPFDLPLFPGTAIHYFAPPNLPSLGAKTTSEALGKMVLPYLIEIIEKGLDQAMQADPVIASGMNIRQGRIVHGGLATVFPDLAHPA